MNLIELLTSDVRLVLFCDPFPTKYPGFAYEMKTSLTYFVISGSTEIVLPHTSCLNGIPRGLTANDIMSYLVSVSFSMFIFMFIHLCLITLTSNLSVTFHWLKIKDISEHQLQGYDYGHYDHTLLTTIRNNQSFSYTL